MGGRKDVYTMAATNKPLMLRDALRRRYEEKIYVPLPDGMFRHWRAKCNNYKFYRLNLSTKINIWKY